ncbi:hypothetical protein [Pseudophaeobacter sp.]|jgi:hypothetical protein|uniref:hypothetical protein n=1 Tax=Pseudophaeobacter sp. TaxID=1971739 RepID=UPI0032D99B3E
MRKFNTRIDDPHFHQIHHALGCPWPDEIMGETYRNYFCIGDDSETAARMRASPHWSDGRKAHGSTYFSVTDAGRAALKIYILENLHVPARYAVTYKGQDLDIYPPSLLPAKSHSAAKYAAYRNSECEWPFVEFMAEIASVKIHSREINSHLFT